MRHGTLALVCFLGAVVGCGQGQKTTEPNGVRITFAGQPTNQINLVDGTATAKVAGRSYDLGVANGKLTVNGQEYGPVANGDKVNIADGEITINGKPAKPITPEQP